MRPSFVDSQSFVMSSQQQSWNTLDVADPDAMCEYPEVFDDDFSGNYWEVVSSEAMDKEEHQYGLQ